MCVFPEHWDLESSLNKLETECDKLYVNLATSESEDKRADEVCEGEDAQEDKFEEDDRETLEEEEEEVENRSGLELDDAQVKNAPSRSSKWRDKTLLLSLEFGEFSIESRLKVERSLSKLHAIHVERLSHERDSWKATCNKLGLKGHKDPLGGWTHSAHVAYLHLVAIPLKLTPGAPSPQGLPARAGGIHRTSTLAGLRAKLCRIEAGVDPMGEEDRDDDICEDRGICEGGGDQASTLLKLLVALLSKCPRSLAPGAAPPSTISPLQLTGADSLSNNHRPPRPPTTTTLNSMAVMSPPSGGPQNDPPISIPTLHQATCHHAWYRELSHHLRREREIKSTYHRELANALTAAKAILAEEAQRSVAAESARASREEAEAVATKSKMRLQRERARAAVEEALARVVEEEIAQAQAAVETAAQRARVVAAARTKRLLSQYHAQVAATEARVESSRRAAEAEMKEQIKIELAKAGERVAARSEETAAKKAALAREALAAQEAAESSREMALRRVLESLPNRGILEEISRTRDPERASSHTVSSAFNRELARSFAEYLATLPGGDVGGRGGDALVESVPWGSAPGSSKGATSSKSNETGTALAILANARIAEQGLFARKGFTDRQVTKNPHFRLVTALRSEGLGGTNAVPAAFSALPATGRGALQALKANSRIEFG